MQSATMKRGLRAALCAGALSAGAVLALPNAVWNDGAKGKSSVAFWVYDKTGACDDLRTDDAKPIVIATKEVKVGEASGPLTLKDLKSCLVYDTPTRAQNCARANVEFSQDPQTREYRGKYELTLADKSTRKGEFRAQYCTPKATKRK